MRSEPEKYQEIAPNEHLRVDQDTDDNADAIETRDVNYSGEADARDALDDAEPLDTDVLDTFGLDDLPIDAIDEIAALPSMDEYGTINTGARAPNLDQAEMGLAAEPHTPEELADAAIGDAQEHERRGIIRDGEEHAGGLLDRH